MVDKWLESVEINSIDINVVNARDNQQEAL